MCFLGVGDVHPAAAPNIRPARMKNTIMRARRFLGVAPGLPSGLATFCCSGGVPAVARRYCHAALKPRRAGIAAIPQRGMALPDLPWQE